jgi:hypothetical protein
MTTFEGKVSTISDTGSDKDIVGYTVDRRDQFRAAIGRPIEIYLPTINGMVRGLAKILSVRGSVARVEFSVDELGPAQLEDIFGNDWRKPTITMFGAAVRDLVFRPGATGNTQSGHQ